MDSIVFIFCILNNYSQLFFRFTHQMLWAIVISLISSSSSFSFCLPSQDNTSYYYHNNIYYTYYKIGKKEELLVFFFRRIFLVYLYYCVSFYSPAVYMESI